jgi:hypothetical protein
MTGNIIEIGSLLLGATAFVYLGFHQFYLEKNVEELERKGKLSSEVAARIRNKPMRRTGWMSIAAGIAFAVLAVMQAIRPG